MTEIFKMVFRNCRPLSLVANVRSRRPRSSGLGGKSPKVSHYHVF